MVVLEKSRKLEKMYSTAHFQCFFHTLGMNGSVWKADMKRMKQKSEIITLDINYVDSVSDISPPLVNSADDQAQEGLLSRHTGDSEKLGACQGILNSWE